MLVATTASSADGVTSRNAPHEVTPAWQHMMSSRPQVSTAVETSATASSGSAMSAAHATARPPEAVMVAQVSAAPDRSRW